MNLREKGVSGTLIAVVVIVIIVAAVAVYFLANMPQSSKSSSSTPVKSVMVLIPKNAGITPAGWNNSHIQSNLYYDPDSIVVVIGVNNTVVWKNNDTVIHTVYTYSVTSGAQSFQSPYISPGQTWNYTFTTPGTYKYYCSIHPWMAGEVIVKS